MHKSFTHENYVQFYNDKIKKIKLKIKCFSSIVVIKITDWVIAIEIVYI